MPNFPNLTSNYAPSIIDVSGLGYVLAYVDTSNNLNLMLSSDRVNYQNPVGSGQKSFDSPALASLNNRVFVAWVGIGNGNVNVAEIVFQTDGSGKTSITGLNFNPATGTMVASTNSAPGLGVSGNQLVLSFSIYSGPGGAAPPIQVMWTGDLVASPANVAFNGPYNLVDSNGVAETSWLATSICSTNSRGTFIAWKGSVNTDISVARIPVNQVSGSNVVDANKAPIFSVTGDAPGLASRNDVIYVAYKANGGELIWLISESSPGSFGVNTLVDTQQTTYAYPRLSAAADQSSVLLGWAGKNNQLNTQSF